MKQSRKTRQFKCKILRWIIAGQERSTYGDEAPNFKTELFIQKWVFVHAWNVQSLSKRSRFRFAVTEWKFVHHCNCKTFDVVYLLPDSDNVIYRWASMKNEIYNPTERKVVTEPTFKIPVYSSVDSPCWLILKKRQWINHDLH